MRKSILILASLFIIATIASLFQQHEVKTFHQEFNLTKAILGFNHAIAYPPGIGILTNPKNCLSCHANNVSWKKVGNNKAVKI